MTVLVTGGAGYIGSHTVLALVDTGERVVVLDDLSTGRRESVHPSARLIVGDAGDSALVTRIAAEYDIQDIIHFAAKLIVPESVSDPLGYYLGNTVKTRSLLAAAVRSGIARFVFSSTAAVYGMPRENPVSEDSPANPISPYGASKLMSEWMLRDTSAAHGLGYVTLRYFNVAGADPMLRSGQASPRSTHLIKVASEAATGQRARLDVFGDDYPTPDGTCVRDYIHVTDLALAHVEALRHLRDGGENLTLNCGYGRGYSVFEVIEAVKRASGADFAVRVGARRPGDPAAIVARADRIRETLAWHPQYDDLATIVRHALAWERKISAKPSAAA
jgi:UDP-glucose 4-epimerase